MQAALTVWNSAERAGELRSHSTGMALVSRDLLIHFRIFPHMAVGSNFDHKQRFMNIFVYFLPVFASVLKMNLRKRRALYMLAGKGWKV